MIICASWVALVGRGSLAGAQTSIAASGFDAVIVSLPAHNAKIWQVQRSPPRIFRARNRRFLEIALFVQMGVIASSPRIAEYTTNKFRNPPEWPKG